jgi:hypothetical protein
VENAMNEATETAERIVRGDPPAIASSVPLVRRAAG